MVRDNVTGLIWTRCSLTDGDKPIYDFNCKGPRKKYYWTEALQACEKLDHEGRTDWRLPNIKELQSIIHYHHYSVGYDKPGQVIDSVFPGTVSVADATEISACRQKQIETIADYYPNSYPCTYANIHYWSSTVHKNDSRLAWFVDFYTGNTAFGWSTGLALWGPREKYVRCVAGP
ncbi:MAG: hypothetical protein CVV49_20650 [Spirochaetae bacterium HGW-Spirochaetae-5]|nr:MAG: hypothetical protein CVV49_20650 [Spirochaetae bacterium HGW-Spirochaetae-5]